MANVSLKTYSLIRIYRKQDILHQDIIKKVAQKHMLPKATKHTYQATSEQSLRNCANFPKEHNLFS